MFTFPPLLFFFAREMDPRFIRIHHLDAGFANCSFLTKTLVVIQIPKQILWHHKNPRPEFRDGIFRPTGSVTHLLWIFFWRSGICKKRCRFSQNEWDVYGKLHFCEKKSELPQPWLNQFSWAFGTPLSIISIGWWLDISSGWRLTIAQARLAVPVVRSKQWTFAGYAIPLIPVKFNEKLRLQRWSGYSNVSAARDLGHSWAPHSIGSPAGKANRKANRNFPVWQRFIATLFHPQRWHSWFLCRILGYNFSGDANPNWGTKKISQQGVIKLYAYIMYIYICLHWPNMRIHWYTIYRILLHIGSLKNRLNNSKND